MIQMNKPVILTRRPIIMKNRGLYSYDGSSGRAVKAPYLLQKAEADGRMPDNAALSTQYHRNIISIILLQILLISPGIWYNSGRIF